MYYTATEVIAQALQAISFFNTLRALNVGKTPMYFEQKIPTYRQPYSTKQHCNNKAYCSKCKQCIGYKRHATY